MSDKFPIANLMFYTMIALLGEIEPNFRGIAVEHSNNNIYIYFYFDGEINDEMENTCTSVGTEVIAHYEDGMGIYEKIIRLDYPARLPMHEHWVYKRKEPNPEI